MARLLFAILILAALAAWVVAAWSAAALFGLAPKGRKLQTYFDVGRWRFDKVRAAVGPAAEPHIRRFRLAFLSFFIVLLSVILFTVLMAWPS